MQKQAPKKTPSVSLSQYLNTLTDIHWESTKTLSDGPLPFYVKCTLGKEHQTDWKMTQEHSPPNPTPISLFEGICTVPANESKCLSKVGSLST